MKRYLSILLTSLVLASCGGGGGDDGNACLSYCSVGCGKAANCGIYPSFNVEVCTNTCFASTQQQSTSDDSCNKAEGFVMGATCQQLADLLGSHSLLRGDKSSVTEGVGAGESLADAALAQTD